MPEFSLEVAHGRIVRMEVIRGAPCGATWEAVKCMKGLPVEEAVARMGLEVQYHCKANPSGWDPISGKSPVHIAGEHHAAAVKRALRKQKR